MYHSMPKYWDSDVKLLVLSLCLSNLYFKPNNDYDLKSSECFSFMWLF